MNWLRNLLTENVGLKLLALALAVALWSAAGGDSRTEILVSVPVEFRNVPPGVRFKTEPTHVQLRVRGFRRIVRAAAAADFAAFLDFAEHPELAETTETAERTVSLRSEDVQAPASVEVVEITPAQVKLSVETVPPE